MAEAPARYCSNCGHELGDAMQFCPNCGSPVHRTAQIPTPEADVPVPPPPNQQQASGPQSFAPTGAAPRQRSLAGRLFIGCTGLFVLGILFVGCVALLGSGGGGDETAGGGGGGAGGGQQAEEPQAAAEGENEEAQEEKPEAEQKPKPEPEPESAKPSFGDGTYQVGTDIQPGTYRTREGSPNCYYERLKDFTGGLNSILANGNTSAPAIITIKPTDAGFNSQGCGTWTKDLSAITESKSAFGAGSYILGTDIEPGTYRNSGGNNCYYERLKDFTGGLNSIIANGNTNNPTIVTLAPSDAGFQSQSCGTWKKLE